MKNLKALFTIFIIVPLFTVYLALSWGFVASKTYIWFIKPVLNTPEVSYISWAGIILFLSVIMPHNITHIKDEYLKDDIYRYTFSIIMPWMGLFTSFAFKIIML